MANILIAEDDDSVRSFVGRALAMDGHRTTVAVDGEEALEILQGGNKFDLLLSDIKMPGMDGIELAHNAAAFDPAMTILLMTGYADQRERAQELDAIVSDVILKPFSLVQIRTAVNGVVAEFRKSA